MSPEIEQIQFGVGSIDVPIHEVVGTSEYQVSSKEEIVGLQEEFLSSFLQTTEWAEFKTQKEGVVPHYIVFKDGSSTSGYAVLLIQRKSLFKKELYVPRGPVLRNPLQFEGAIACIEDFGRRHHLSSLKIEPDFRDGHSGQIDYQSVFRKYKKVDHDVGVQPTKVALLKIGSRSEMEGQINSKYRGRVRNKFDLKLKENETVENFFDIYSNTAERQRFTKRDITYFRDMQRVLKDKAKIFGVYRGDTLIASSFDILHGDTLTYLYSGSMIEYNNMYPGYFLVFESALAMRDRGAQIMDLWGVSDDNPEWKGFSEFKRNMGSRVVNFPGSFETALK
jgi:lipid II:glycine glycyltransferase (peptidoglycan interpeptide bridge formation enzyme)